MWAVPGYSARKWELETRAALLGFLVEKVVLVQIPIRVDCVWNVMAHAQKSDLVFRAKRTSPFKSARGASVQSTTSSRGVRISGSNAGYTMFRVWRVLLATHCIRQFPHHFPSRGSPCAIIFQLESTKCANEINGILFRAVGQDIILSPMLSDLR